MLVLMLQVSRLESLVFLWPRRVYGGSCETSPFRTFPSRLSCGFVWQAWHFVTFQPVSDASKGAILLRRFQKMICSFPGRRSTSDVSHCLLYTVHSALHTLHFTLHTLHSTLHTLHSTLYTPHSTLCTLHFTLYTLHSTLYALHSTLYTPHSTLYTLHSALHTLHSTLYTPHFALHALHLTLYTPHSTLRTLHTTLLTLHSTLYTAHFTLHTLHFRLHTLHFTLLTPHFTLHTLHCTLHAGKRITLEHTLRHHFRTQPFCITLEHKIKHLMETPPYTHTHQIYWQARDFGRKTRSKARPTQKTSSYENLTRFNHVIKSHACHVKRQSMYKSATPATQNEGRCQKVPRLPQKMKVNIWNKSLVVLDVRRATRPLGFICCCTWCKDCHDTFRVYMLLHLM